MIFAVAIRTEAADESITQTILQQLDESLQQLAPGNRGAKRHCRSGAGKARVEIA